MGTARNAAGALVYTLDEAPVSQGASAAAPLFVSQAAQALPNGTDRSGSITTASTAQDVAPANTNRVGLTFQNTSDTVMRLSENGTDASATNGYSIAAGNAVNVSTNRRISVFCATAGKTYAATEY